MVAIRDGLLDFTLAELRELWKKSSRDEMCSRASIHHAWKFSAPFRCCYKN
jgi:hypothetical protein